MSLIADYFKECDGYELVEIPGKAFAMYRIGSDGGEFHIAHLYIAKEHRATGLLLEFGNQLEALAKERGCKAMTCMVQIYSGNEGVQSRLSYLYLKWGFRILACSPTNIIFIKELN